LHNEILYMLSYGSLKIHASFHKKHKGWYSLLLFNGA
jgi:hypothetical protein